MADRWSWKATRGILTDLERESRLEGPWESLDEAYDRAERWWDAGARHVAIILRSKPDNTGVADTRDRERREAEWVCGRERWRGNHEQAIREGRASDLKGPERSEGPFVAPSTQDVEREERA